MDTISFDDFKKVEIRIGKILTEEIQVSREPVSEIKKT